MSVKNLFVGLGPLLVCVLLTACASNFGVVEITEEVSPGLQKAAPIDNPDADPVIYRQYDPKTDAWYRVEKDKSGRWVYTANSQALRDEALAELGLPSTGDEVRAAEAEARARAEAEKPAAPAEEAVAAREGGDEAPGVVDRPAPGEPVKETAEAEPQKETPEAETTEKEAAPGTETAEKPAYDYSHMPEGAGVVEITATDGCWISTMIDMTTRKDFFLREGQGAILKFERRLTVKFGDPDSVDIIYNGSPVSAPQNGELLHFPPAQ